jgi:hypothetical protein
LRSLCRLFCLVLVVTACAGPDVPPSASAEPAGILFVQPGEQVQARPPTEEIALAFSKAMQLAEAFGEDLGYPWIDPVTSELVLSIVTQRGRDLVESAGITVPHRIRIVTHGATELLRIQDDATFLHGQGVPGSELLYQTLPDHRDNRALLVIKQRSDLFVEALSARYPVDALAIEVNPTGG